MIITDQKINDTTPYTLSLLIGTGSESLGLKAVWMVIGLVPMSPNTTPSAPPKLQCKTDLLTFPWVGSTASIGHFWAAADAAGRSLTCPLPAQRVHRGSRVKGGRRPSQRDALAPLTREGCTRRRRGPDLHARTGTQSRCSEIDPRKRHKSLDC